MAEYDSGYCVLCRKPFSPEEIESGKAIVMGSMKVIRRSCLSHFYSDMELRKQVPDYQYNMDVMAMSVVWAERQTTDVERDQETHDGHSLAGKQALIVEDHPECSELLKMILEDEGCKVRCAETGTAALQFFNPSNVGPDADFVPDLVLLDLRLPDMRGDEFIAQLMERGSTLPPTVMLSADTPQSLFSAAKRVGVMGLRKPFDYSSLLSAIALAQSERRTSSAR